ncbi:MAG: tRNA lysidine(34) synthetase TilS [Bacteroidota bacterium]
MLDKFLQKVKTKGLFSTDSNLLVAASGGIDSMTLCHLLREGGFKFSVAHCNFKLRGAESKQDEKLVMEWCGFKSIPFYSKSFQTKRHAKNHGVSIQMAARFLRYQWFNDLAKAMDFQFILTAHNLDDSLETSLFNFTKGTGLRGLIGIPEVKNNLVRPLLTFSRREIQKFATENKVRWREDASNSDSKYQRNRLRHRVIPELKPINPSLLSTYKNSKVRLAESHSYLMRVISKKFEPFLSQSGQDIFIKTLELTSVVELEFLLYPYHFRYNQLNAILEACLSGGSGKLFFSASHQLNIDRDQIIISPVTGDFYESVIHSEDEEFIHEFYKLKMSVRPASEGVLFTSKSASLDFDKLSFPLKFRKWHTGDVFYPLGMKGKKKVSDYMIDCKIPLNLKERVGVLESDGAIVWIVGHRIDDRFKVTDQTKRIYQVELK